MNKILVDTNILIYAIDEDSKFHTDSRQLIEAPDYFLYTTSKNISEFLTVLTRAGSITISVDEALRVLDSLMTNFTILYPTEASMHIFKKLLKKYKPGGLRIHDFEIVSIGLQNGINHIATKNIADFKVVEEIELIDF